jgi:hypothetical protein
MSALECGSDPNREELRHWCRRGESNPRPRDYETLALPLSYAGKRNSLCYGVARECVKANAGALEFLERRSFCETATIAGVCRASAASSSPLEQDRR